MITFYSPKNLLLPVLLCITCIYSFAQKAPAIQWQKCIGGGSADVAHSMQTTPDGGFIIAGNTSYVGFSTTGNVSGYKDTVLFNNDCWVTKLNSNGDIQWQKCYGGVGNDDARYIQNTPDGGYIFAGSTAANNKDVQGNHLPGGLDIWVVKLNSSGGIQWQKCLGGFFGEYATEIQNTPDGGYIVTGNTSSNDNDVSGNHSSSNYNDIWVVKLDKTGNIQWQKCYGGSAGDNAGSITPTKDGGYIFAGGTSFYVNDPRGIKGFSDFYVVKLNSNGDMQWQKYMGGFNYSNFENERAYCVRQTKDGGYILTGNGSRDGDITGGQELTNIWVVKLDNAGSISWQKSFGGSNYEEAASIEQMADGGYIVGGSTMSTDGDVTSNHGKYDYWLLRLDGTGNLLWQKTMGGSEDDIATTAVVTPDGGYAISGFTRYTGRQVSGDVTDPHGDYDFWLVKLAPDAVMPLTLLDFSAAATGNNAVALHWQTANEVNCSHFIPERSTDGLHFSQLPPVKALNQPANSYTITDNNPVAGINYYRLQQYDLDGRVTFSKIVRVNVAGVAGLTLLSNPVDAVLRLQYDAANAGTANVVITGIGGKVLTSSTITLSKGANAINMPVSTLPAGYYVVRVVDGGGQDGVKFYKR